MLAAFWTAFGLACGQSTSGDLPAPRFDAGARVIEAGPGDASLVAEDAPADAPDDLAENIAPAVEASDDADGAQCLTCSAYGTPTTLGPVPSILPELSGLAASRLHPGILYAHNDSGDSARFFAINDHAEIQAEIDLVGASATDWEDIDMGPCPSGSCVYVGDIGDNKSTRTEYTIYRVPEPDAWPTDGSSLTPTFERFPFVYPDGAHNAETLLVHPSTGRVFVVTKVSGVPSTVYELPLPLTPDVTATLVLLTAVSLPASAGLVTGGSFHPCADRLLLRTYSNLYEFWRPADGALEAIFTSQPMPVPVASEPKGEAVTYASDGNAYYTSSETVAGAPQAVLSVVSCL